jgi:hypothetical protein
LRSARTASRAGDHPDRQLARYGEFSFGEEQETAMADAHAVVSTPVRPATVELAVRIRLLSIERRGRFGTESVVLASRPEFRSEATVIQVPVPA